MVEMVNFILFFLTTIKEYKIKTVSVLSKWFLKSVYLCLAVLGLGCSAQAFSSVGEQPAICGPRASHFGGISCCGEGALGHAGLVAVAHRLSCPEACGIFPDQGSNPGLLHWQMDS